MARDIVNRTNVDPVSGTNPYGASKDESAPAANDGTVYEEALHGDILIFFQRLMALGGVVANELPDNTVNSFQLYQALINTILQNVSSVVRLVGVIDASTNPNYPAGVVGEAYLFSASGKIGGVLGEDVTSGDMLICLNDNAGGNEAAVGNDWFVLERNEEQATETVLGILKLATQVLTDAGVDDLTAVTPLKLKNALIAQTQATEIVPGILKLATQVLTDAGVDDLTAVTPLKLKNAITVLQNAGNTGAFTKIKTKVIEIGDWNMDTSAFISVNHGLGNPAFKNTRIVGVMIRDDGNTIISPLAAFNTANEVMEGGWDQIVGATIRLVRRGGGMFDNASYNATPFNRGFITFTYEE